LRPADPRPPSIRVIVARLLGPKPRNVRHRDLDRSTMTGPPEEQPVTDPNDETQPQPPAGSGPGADGATSTGADLAGPTEPAPTEPAPTGSPSPAATPPLQADPDRPADSGWREPAWFPSRQGGRHRDRDPRPGPFAIVVGLVLIAAGLYAFVDRTLGIALPAITWSSLWPVILILIGGMILVRSFQRRA
jgi:hypothetical protein